MSICQNLSLVQDNIPQSHTDGLSSEKQPQSPDISGESSEVKKRKRDNADESVDCSNRTPHTSPTKKRRSGCLDPVPTETKEGPICSCETNKSQRKTHWKKRGENREQRYLSFFSCVHQVEHQPHRARSEDNSQGHFGK
ncbi:hypothetical protein PAMP_014141 [Pampus punctatissimus]